MYPWHAKKLKKGDRVLWRGDPRQVDLAQSGDRWGTVIRKYYNTIYIEWDGHPPGFRVEWVVDDMTHIFTQEQLDKMEQEKRAVEAVKQMNAEMVTTHNADGTRRKG